MDHFSTLPPELLHLILIHLPSTPNLRLTSRTFSSSPIVFTHTFKHLLKTWLCEKASHRMISEVASDLVNRPAVMWSPWAMEENMDEDMQMEMMMCSGVARAKRNEEEVFLRVVWRLVLGSQFSPPSQDCGEDGEGEGVKLTVENFAPLSGLEEFTEKRLRMGRTRFLLNRKLMREDSW